MQNNNSSSNKNNHNSNLSNTKNNNNNNEEITVRNYPGEEWSIILDPREFVGQERSSTYTKFFPVLMLLHM